MSSKFLLTTGSYILSLISFITLFALVTSIDSATMIVAPLTRRSQTSAVSINQGGSYATNDSGLARGYDDLTRSIQLGKTAEFAKTAFPQDTSLSNAVSYSYEDGTHILRIDLHSNEVKFRTAIANHDQGGRQSVAGMAQDHNAIAAINADYFCVNCDPCCGSAHWPLGMTWINGVDRTYRGQNYWKADYWLSSLAVSASNQADIARKEARLNSPNNYNVVGGGPQFIFNGQFRWNFENRGTDVLINDEPFKPDAANWYGDTRAKTAAGISADGRWLILAVNPNGKNMEQFGQVLIGHSVSNAIRFDSGSSSAMYYNGQTLISGRDVANALLVLPADVIPPCNPNADQIALFADGNFSGQCVVKGIGQYPNPGAIGLPNDSVSSIRVGGSVKAILCRDDGYAGGCEEFNGDDPDLGNNSIGNDQVSSARVESRLVGCNPDRNQVALYANSGYGGSCLTLGIGDYPTPGNLGSVGNDNAESIKVGSDVQAILCEHDNYQGTCETFTGDDDNLGNNLIGTNRVSSARIQQRPNSTVLLNFTIKLQGHDWSGNHSTKVYMEVRNVGATSYIFRQPVSTDSSGRGSLSLIGVNPGTYDIYVKGQSHLARKKRAVVLSSGVNTIDFSEGGTTYLLVGDVDGSNKVNSLDYSRLLFNFKLNDPCTDFDGSQQVNSLDFSLLLSNWFREGEGGENWPPCSNTATSMDTKRVSPDEGYNTFLADAIAQETIPTDSSLLASTADLKLIPSTAYVSVGDEFEISIALSTGATKPVCAYDASLHFDESKLQVSSLEIPISTSSYTFSKKEVTENHILLYGYAGSSATPFTGEMEIAKLRLKGIKQGIAGVMFNFTLGNRNDSNVAACNTFEDSLENVIYGLYNVVGPDSLLGDCNGDGTVDAGDISALILEIFDGDGDKPEDIPGGTFPAAAGCDANQDDQVNAGDISCSTLLIFNGAGACGGGNVTQHSPSPNGNDDPISDGVDLTPEVFLPLVTDNH